MNTVQITITNNRPSRAIPEQYSLGLGGSIRRRMIMKWQVTPEILSDESVVWNITGYCDIPYDDDEVATKIEIGCDGPRQAKALAKALNNTAYVHNMS